MSKKGKEQTIEVEISEPEMKEVVLEEIPQIVEPPVLVRAGEFLQIISKQYPVESMGGFIYWLKKQGMPPKWPLNMWKAKLEEYLNRKL